MDNVNLIVLRTLRDWQRNGQRTLLATVLRTWGSSPRPVGSILAISESGGLVGSVSGGCIEDDLLARSCAEWLADPGGRPSRRPPESLRYGISADEAFRFGLPCGGTVELLLERDPDPESLERLVAGLSEGRLILRTVHFDDGHVDQHETSAPEDLRVDAQSVTNTFGPEYRMLLIGSGHLSEYLATMALFNGFEVTVCDPREEYRSGWGVPGVAVLTAMPDDVVAEFHADARTAVIALSHDPKLDDLALMEALRTPAFYVGAIGSRRNNDARRRRLEEHFDMAPKEVARLRGPIGVYIGSKTPPEIAVSVMAEVLAAKNGVHMAGGQSVAAAKNAREVAHDEGGSCHLSSRSDTPA